MGANLIYSADSHVNEPVDLWVKSMGAKFGDRTPRLVEEFRGEKGRFFFTGLRVMKLADDEDELRRMGLSLQVAYEPDARLAFQRQAGVDCEIIYPTFGLHQLVGPDREAMRRACEVYNDWAVEFCGHDRKRLVPVATIPVDDVRWAVAEMERCRKTGHWGAMVSLQPPVGLPPYRDSMYAPIWSAAERLGMPLTLHLATGRRKTPIQAAVDGTTDGMAGIYMSTRTEIMDVLADDFIWGGILDRHPKLDIICSEFEISWIPFFCAKMDEMQFGMGHRLKLPKIEMKASDYVVERVWHVLINDRFGAETVKIVGPKRILWGSDFPHVRSIGLNVRRYVDTLLGALDSNVRQQVVADNCVGLLGRTQ